MFIQKPKASQQATPANSPKPSRAYLTQSQDVNSILHLRCAIGDHIVQGLQNNEKELNAGFAGTVSPHLGTILPGFR
jgi:hypothetical protein